MNVRKTLRRLGLAFVFVLLIGVACVAWMFTSTYEVDQGRAYRVGRVFGFRIFLFKAFDPDFYAKNYVIVVGKPHVKDPESDKLFPTRQHFKEDFESATRIHDLIDVTERWSHFTLQSPSARSVNDYNRLRNQILKGEADFIDNRVEPSDEQVHSGKRALKILCVGPDGQMGTCKASLHAGLFHFAKGEDVWFSAWYFIEKRGKYNTLMDLESTWVRNHPGMRIVLHDGYLELQLAKWLPNISYRQPRNSRKPMPEKQWVHIKVHLKLSDDPDGIIQLWQNDDLLIDTKGKTLPFAKAMLDNLEIGISAHALTKDEAIFYVDDVELSTQPIK